MYLLFISSFQPCFYLRCVSLDLGLDGINFSSKWYKWYEIPGLLLMKCTRWRPKFTDFQIMRCWVGWMGIQLWSMDISKATFKHLSSEWKTARWWYNSNSKWQINYILRVSVQVFLSGRTDWTLNFTLQLYITIKLISDIIFYFP